jgi:hypothetical protein
MKQELASARSSGFSATNSAAPTSVTSSNFKPYTAATVHNLMLEASGTTSSSTSSSEGNFPSYRSRKLENKFGSRAQGQQQGIAQFFISKNMTIALIVMK